MCEGKYPRFVTDTHFLQRTILPSTNMPQTRYVYPRKGASYNEIPGFLPQDSLKEEEKLKKELRLRMAYAGFLQETVTEMAVKKKTRCAPPSMIRLVLLFFLLNRSNARERSPHGNTPGRGHK